MPCVPTKALAQNGVGLSNLMRDRVVVDLLDHDVLVVGDRDRCRRRILRVLPVEDDVVGGEGLAVVPGDALLELPGDRLAVGGEGAVLAAGDRRRQDGLEIAVGIPAGQRLVEQARAVLILGADREVRIEQGRALPPQHLQRGRRRRAWSACRSSLASAPSQRRKWPAAASPSAPSALPPSSCGQIRGGTARPSSPGRSDRAVRARSWHTPVLSSSQSTLSLSCKMRATLILNRPGSRRQRQPGRMSAGDGRGDGLALSRFGGHLRNRLADRA